MIPVVLLKGYLSREVLERAYSEISRIILMGGQTINLVVDSDGGDIRPAVEFVRKVKYRSLQLDVKIYNAQSAAAFLVVALGNSRMEMLGTAELGFHRGSLQIEASDISPDGHIPEEMLKAFREYDEQLSCALKGAGVDDPKLSAQLYGYGWLTLSANQCLQYGVVQKLF